MVGGRQDLTFSLHIQLRNLGPGHHVTMPLPAPTMFLPIGLRLTRTKPHPRGNQPCDHCHGAHRVSVRSPTGVSPCAADGPPHKLLLILQNPAVNALPWGSLRLGSQSSVAHRRRTAQGLQPFSSWLPRPPRLCPGPQAEEKPWIRWGLSMGGQARAATPSPMGPRFPQRQMRS